MGGPGAGADPEPGASAAASRLHLRAADIKQYMYCPRIPYYTYALPLPHRSSRKMEYGLEEHFRLERLEKRRRLSRYGLEEGERRFRVALDSPRLALSGVLDLLITTRLGRFPVEFKFSAGGPRLNHKYQLVAYALLVEDCLGCAVRAGFIYLVPSQQIHPVWITAEAREFCHRVMAAIRDSVARPGLPEPTRHRARCRDCEYRRFCGDRL
ncbi:MAG: CRISPR-associated protein Cas4 [Acetobacteraceae bacterium]|nr:CRISPR-associated protein Cas4 [Acetobacteraceae bacterium]